MARATAAAAAVALASWGAVEVRAQRPLTSKASCGEDFGSSASALAIPDPSIAWSLNHYFDCKQRAVWLSLKNPVENGPLYLGVSTPTSARFADLRADAVIIGPGLPMLSVADLRPVPEEVKWDPAWSPTDGSTAGGVVLTSPDDQSSCAHLGSVMGKASEVMSGRCTYHDHASHTKSWRLLDSDSTTLPVKGGTYHIAVWLRNDTSAKLGLTVGTLVEDFLEPFDLPTPSCERVVNDWSEKRIGTKDCFPVVQCPEKMFSLCTAQLEQEPECSDLGKAASDKDYKPKMGCGGEDCGAAVKMWDEVNMAMHKGMAISYTCDENVDFVRGMVPHHEGAVAMCEVLRNLTCGASADMVDGMDKFCDHVRVGQMNEIKEMKAWLKKKGHDERSEPCSGASGDDDAKDDSDDGHSHRLRRRLGDHQDQEGASMGCGDLSCASSKRLMTANREMHDGMAIKFSCNAIADFARSMLPHHAGAVVMCDVLVETAGAKVDPFLRDLCANITSAQRAEVAWLQRWLEKRDFKTLAPCDCEDPAPEPEPPCEDTLPTSSLCNLLHGEYCKCEELIEKHACGTMLEMKGIGKLSMKSVCARTCGACSKDSELFPQSCKDEKVVPKEDPETWSYMGAATSTTTLSPVLLVVSFVLSTASATIMHLACA